MGAQQSRQEIIARGLAEVDRITTWRKDLIVDINEAGCFVVADIKPSKIGPGNIMRTFESIDGVTYVYTYAGNRILGGPGVFDVYLREVFPTKIGGSLPAETAGAPDDENSGENTLPSGENTPNFTRKKSRKSSNVDTIDANIDNPNTNLLIPKSNFVVQCEPCDIDNIAE